MRESLSDFRVLHSRVAMEVDTGGAAPLGVVPLVAAAVVSKKTGAQEAVAMLVVPARVTVATAEAQRMVKTLHSVHGQWTMEPRRAERLGSSNNQ